MIPTRFLEAVRHQMTKRKTEPRRPRPAHEIRLSARREEARHRNRRRTG